LKQGEVFVNKIIAGEAERGASREHFQQSETLATSYDVLDIVHKELEQRKDEFMRVPSSPLHKSFKNAGKLVLVLTHPRTASLLHVVCLMHRRTMTHLSNHLIDEE
jgi:hypothetical protein